MSEKDLAINITGVPNVGALSKKPPHLVIVESVENKKQPIFFISLDKPNSDAGFINVKGFFTSIKEEEIYKTYNEIIANISKENFEEIMFPISKIIRIKNLVFKAK